MHFIVISFDSTYEKQYLKYHVFIKVKIISDQTIIYKVT